MKNQVIFIKWPEWGSAEHMCFLGDFALGKVGPELKSRVEGSGPERFVREGAARFLRQSGGN